MGLLRLAFRRQEVIRCASIEFNDRRLTAAYLRCWFVAFMCLVGASAGTTTSHAAGIISSAASLSVPTGLALDASGNTYVSSQNRVHKVNSSGTITVIAGTGAYGFGGDGGSAITASFTNAFGLAVDSAGNVYVADNGNNRIRRITPAGVITTVAGTGAAGFGGDGGLATAAMLKAPSGVAVDSTGNIYFNDTLNYRVRKIDAAGRISTVAGSGVNGQSGDGGQATAAALGEAYGVAVDAAGNLYIADSLNNRIRKVGASGTISTIAGTGLAGFAGDGGPGTSAALNNPVSVAVDTAGNVIIADQNNLRIRMIDSSGSISTAAGNGTAGYSGDGGLATSASMAYPSAVATTSAGTFLIADSNNNRIRKVTAGSASPIVGSWQVSGPDKPGEIFTFTSDGKYYHAEDTRTPPPRAIDMEYGTYSWDSSTGAFSHTTTVDTDSNLSSDMQVGFGHARCSKAVVSGDILTLTCADLSSLTVLTSFTLNRVVSTTSTIVGGWFIGTGTSNRITTFLGDGTYMSSGNEDPAVTPNGQKGMERGTYTWNSSTGSFSHATIVDTDGQWGLSHSICNKAVVSGDTLTLTCADTSKPTVFSSFTASRVAEPAVPATPTTPAAPTSNQTVAPPPSTQAAYTASAGRMPTAAVTTSATGTLGSVNLTVTLDLAQVLSGGSFAVQGQFAAGYNVYVIALVPGSAVGAAAPLLFVLPESRAWTSLAFPIAAFMSNVANGAANQTVTITILQSTNMMSLLGTEFYIGYGLDSSEMLTSGRYRGVYKVQ